MTAAENQNKQQNKPLERTLPGGEHAIEVSNYSFKYESPYVKGPIPYTLTNLMFNVPHGSRCLMLGGNGAGKSTLLRCLAGKHIHEKDQVLVLGYPAFYQTLGVSGITYIGGEWTRTVAFAGKMNYAADIEVSQMMLSLQNEHKERRDELVRILEIDQQWRMHEVSDGQRRRVQLMLGLLRPFKLLLLDEVTVDLDILCRKDFLNYLKKETEERGCTIVYVSHIMDGLNDWPTHLLGLDDGKIERFVSYKELTSQPGFSGLYQFYHDWLTNLKKKRLEEAKERKARGEVETAPKSRKSDALFCNNGFQPGRMLSYYGSK